MFCAKSQNRGVLRKFGQNFLDSLSHTTYVETNEMVSSGDTVSTYFNCHWGVGGVLCKLRSELMKES